MTLTIAKKIYDNICDEKSKEIFINRVLFNLTNDSKYIDNILSILNLIDEESANKKIKKNGKKIFIFGAGSYGQSIVKYYPNINHTLP